jgi:hypothetical protein
MSNEYDQYHSDEFLKKADEIIKRSINNLVEEVKQGRIEKYTEYLSFISRFHNYSFNNQMLIYSQRPDASHVAGRWLWEQMGCQVKPWEIYRPILILAPVKIKDKRLVNGNLEPYDRLLGFKSVKLYDVSQLDRPEKVFYDHLVMIKNDPQKAIKLIKQAADSDGLLMLNEKELIGRRNFQSIGKRISTDLDEEITPRDKLMTLIIRWSRYKIDLNNKEKFKEETFRETVKGMQVESVAFVVGNHLGVYNPLDEISFLSNKNQTEYLIRNLDRVQQTSKEIIDKIELIYRSTR